MDHIQIRTWNPCRYRNVEKKGTLRRRPQNKTSGCVCANTWVHSLQVVDFFRCLLIESRPIRKARSHEVEHSLPSTVRTATVLVGIWCLKFCASQFWVFAIGGIWLHQSISRVVWAKNGIDTACIFIAFSPLVRGHQTPSGAAWWKRLRSSFSSSLSCAACDPCTSSETEGRFKLFVYFAPALVQLPVIKQEELQFRFPAPGQLQWPKQFQWSDLPQRAATAFFKSVPAFFHGSSILNGLLGLWRPVASTTFRRKRSWKTKRWWLIVRECFGNRIHTRLNSVECRKERARMAWIWGSVSAMSILIASQTVHSMGKHPAKEVAEVPNKRIKSPLGCSDLSERYMQTWNSIGSCIGFQDLRCQIMSDTTWSFDMGNNGIPWIKQLTYQNPLTTPTSL